MKRSYQSHANKYILSEDLEVRKNGRILPGVAKSGGPFSLQVKTALQCSKHCFLWFIQPRFFYLLDI